MKLSELRDELLEQHVRLRRLAAEVREAVEDHGSAEDGELLSARVDALRAELEAHNQREVELLGHIIPSVDAWGEVRAARMDELHIEEHRKLQQALDEATTGDPARVEAVLQVIDQLLAHMNEEEKAYLNESVLRDDVINVGQSGG